MRFASTIWKMMLTMNMDIRMMNVMMNRVHAITNIKYGNE